MSQVFELATRVSNPWALAAFAVAAALLACILLIKRRNRIPRVLWAALAAIVIIPLSAIWIESQTTAIYRLRVTVVGAGGVPTEDAKVWSSFGGEAKKVAGGWQFDIPAAERPADHKLTVWASEDDAYLRGSEEVTLSADRNPAVTVELRHDSTATIRGLVLNKAGNGVAGARVSVAGYDKEAASTSPGGDFRLPAHAANGQKVLLHVEAAGYVGMTQWEFAGAEQPVTVVLKRN